MDDFERAGLSGETLTRMREAAYQIAIAGLGWHADTLINIALDDFEASSKRSHKAIREIKNFRRKRSERRSVTKR